jgi:outer membrane autotransporter protein
VTQTPNQFSVARALEAGPLTSPLVLAILNQTVPGALRAFDALSGEIHGTLHTVLIDDARYARGAVLGRLRSMNFPGLPAGLAPLAFGGPQTASAAEAFAAIDRATGSDRAESARDEALAYVPKPRRAVRAPVVKPPPVPDTDLTFWTQGYGAWGRTNGDGNAASMHRDLGGFITGVDRSFGDIWRAGVAAGYSRANVSVADRSSSASVDSFHLTAYAGAQLGAWALRTGAAFAWHNIDTTRTVIFPGFFDVERASYHGTTSQAFGEVGYGLMLGRVAAEPFAGAAWVRVETNSFAETGGIGALNGAATSQGVAYSTLGARFATSMMQANGMMVVPRASLAWQHAFGDVASTAALALQNTGTAFGIRGLPLARDAALVEAGLDFKLTLRATLGIAYTGQIASAAQDHGVRGRFVWNF